MKITTTQQATRAMTVAFRITTRSLGKSDARQAEIRSMAKRIVAAAEAYMERRQREAG